MGSSCSKDSGAVNDPTPENFDNLASETPREFSYLFILIWLTSCKAQRVISFCINSTDYFVLIRQFTCSIGKFWMF